MEHRYHVAEVKSLKEKVSSLRKECESLPGMLSELKDQRSETVKYKDETMSALIENCQLKIVNKKLDNKKGEERKHNMVLRKEVQHLRISCQNLTHENKMQRQGLLKEIRRYIGPKVNIDTCDRPLVESQWLFTDSASSVDSNCVSTVKVHTVSQTSSVAKIVDTPTQISSLVPSCRKYVKVLPNIFLQRKGNFSALFATVGCPASQSFAYGYTKWI